MVRGIVAWRSELRGSIRNKNNLHGQQSSRMNPTYRLKKCIALRTRERGSLRQSERMRDASRLLFAFLIKER